MTSDPDSTAGKQAGRFAPGRSGNPKGRPKGSRNKLAEEFIAGLCADWEKHGADAIVKVREESPAAYLKVIASVIPREIKIEQSRLDEMTDEELAAAIDVLRRSIVAENDSRKREDHPPSTLAH